MLLCLHNPVYSAWLDLQHQLNVQSHDRDQSLFVGLSGTYHNGSRQTEVVNKQEEFLPPRLLLSAYVEQMSWGHRRMARLQAGALRDVDKVRSLYVMSVWCLPSSENKSWKKKVCFLLSGCSLVSVVHFPFIFTTSKLRPCVRTEATSYTLHDKLCG